jgi:hypothetical protein
MKKIFAKFGAWASTLPILLLPAVTFAQISRGQEQLGEVATASEFVQGPSLPVMIGNLINILLSIVGVYFVVIIVYAGWLYLSDSGDSAKVKKAKTLMGQAVIGIAIILAAYSISNFVIENLATIASG